MLKNIGILLLAASSCAGAAVHDQKNVSAVQSSGSSNCIYFTLEGVGEADPVKPSEPWFTVAADNPSKNEILSLATAAFALGAKVKVTTTGAQACGFAEVSYIRLVK